MKTDLHARFPFVLAANAALCLLMLAPMPAWAQTQAGAAAPPAGGQSQASPPPQDQAVVPATVTCTSRPGERQHCPADTSRGVVLARSTGESACLLGKTWGYDDQGVWVAEGCSGVFVLGQAAATGAGNVPEAPAGAAQPTTQSENQPAERIESWGEFEPGGGFLVGRSSAGELSISAYALIRYVNQLPVGQTFTDHLGNEHPVDSRQDVFPHRIMIFLKGWLASPKLIYNIFLWTVNTTDQKNIFASMGYQFSRKFSLYGGINGIPGTRSLQGSHPYWLGNDRVLADEFFRPYFSNGVWVQGEVAPGLWYNAMVGNNMSALGVKATQLDRKFSGGVSGWWMPTTHEFGPRGAYGDWESHEKVATRVGVSWSYSPEERYTDASTGATGNTTIRLADSLNAFDMGALAPDVTVQNMHYRLLSFDAGMKYRGFFLQTEVYNRWLDHFVADGLLPVSSIHDWGFYVQGSFYPIKKRLELYGATSQIFGDKSTGFSNSNEYLAGMNVYPWNTRNHRLNFQVIDVNRSPVSSTFGYYTGGQKGTTVAVAFSIFF